MTNAIILAAGKGERLLPLTLKTPKPLLKVMDERIIERQIRFLKEAHIDYITIVVGYLYEEFLYLKDKYKNVELVINDRYESSNNFYSLFLVRNKLENTWIIEGDIFLMKNIFETHQNAVYYSSLKPVVEYEWYFEYDRDHRIQSIHIADKQTFPDKFGGRYHINMGISFWDHKSSLTIRNLFEKTYNSKNEFDIYKNGYWDKLIFDYLDKFYAYIHLVNENDWYEIDSIDDWRKVTKTFQKANTSSCLIDK